MSTESILSTIHLTLSPPALDLERCPSPSSTRAIYTTSRPNSYNPFEAQFDYAALADLANIQTPGEIVEVKQKHGDARSIRSNGTSATCRSRAVRRSDAARNLPVVEDADEAFEGQVREETEKGKGKQREKVAGEKKTWATSSKKWKRTMSQLFSSAKENAGILDRAAPAATTPMTVPTTTPVPTLSQRARQRAPSLFQFGRSRTMSAVSKKTLAGDADCGRAGLMNHRNVSTLNFRNLTVDTVAARKARNQRVRRSRSFSGFAGIDLGSSPDAEVASPAQRGQFNVYGFPQVVDSPAPLEDEEEELDGLDDVTREATAVSRSVGAEWGYVDEE